ncbi:putative cytochrome c oxidase subunit 2a [Babesia bovis T2Bo]|uniref:Cytochrome c oxidase subunit 2a, putative n=1 Tax=Babesia bovis TaxID=5865 RepID=A7AV43_BABBO|nr:putative cytochrome c oxidase subunit 2a [Babesia bovis T2Bo]EDO05669.1 putative cytochrome c oxidase subunit 2a [Babesia bovis T2Bo]|eukprot:XP_001609237.1 cytochrome c oxidase subunit 2a [Babesia bovis T2Bo]
MVYCIFRSAFHLRNGTALRHFYRSSNATIDYKYPAEIHLTRRLTSTLCGQPPTRGDGSTAKSTAPEVDAAAPPYIVDDGKVFKQGKYPGLGLPKAVGQPEDLPSIEFGKPTGMYNFVRHQHGDPRGHLQSDGRYRPSYAADSFHWFDAYTDVPKQQFTIVNGETMIVGKETRPMEELFGVEQTNIPFYARRRVKVWGNHNLILTAEFCFFWIPTLIIMGLAVPCYTMIYMMDEAVSTSMTVKVIGHQWYWVYEVESPPVLETEAEEADDE